MLIASIISLNILVLILIVIVLKQNRIKSAQRDPSDIELEMDLDKLSHTHYLLEAGKNEWRINDKDYNDSHALLIYTLGLVFNNPVIYFDSDKLAMTLNRIRLPYLLDKHTDATLSQQQRVEELTDILFKQREAIEQKLVELYNLPSQEENRLSDNLADTLNKILNH